MAKEDNTNVKGTFDFLEDHQCFMSLEQMDFVKSLKKYYAKHKKLSERQQTALFEIRKYLNIEN